MLRSGCIINLLNKLTKKKDAEKVDNTLTKTVPTVSSSLSDDAQKQLLRDGIFFGAILTVLLFLLWKCLYGIANVDESFYLTVPYRLIQGDGLFVDEWNLSQMSGLLTMPIVWLYMTLTGGVDGLVLFVRYVFVFAQVAAACFVYFRFRSISWVGASCAAVVFALYAPFGIMALSYNSMAILGLVLCMTLLLPSEKFRRTYYIFAGLSFSAAVLCCPYLVFVFAIYVAVVLVRSLVLRLLKKTSSREMTAFTLKGLLFFSVGVAIAVVLFLLFVLTRGSLKAILSSFTHILNDPSHPTVTFQQTWESFWRNIKNRGPECLQAYKLLGIVLLVAFVDFKRKNHKMLYFLLAGGATLILVERHIRVDYINHLMWSISAIGPIVALLSEKKIVRTLFFTFWSSGMLFSFCSKWGSNQGYYAITSASTVAAVGTVLMLGIFIGELRKEEIKPLFKSAAIVLTCLLLSTQIMSEVMQRYKSVFWESNMESQTEKITYGVQEGIYVTPYRLNDYNRVYSILEEMKKYGGETAVFLTEDPRFYLYGEYKVGAFSAWMSDITDRTIERLEAYYEANPEKIPDVGYIEVWENYEYMEAIAERFKAKYGFEWEHVGNGVALFRK